MLNVYDTFLLLHGQKCKKGNCLCKHKDVMFSLRNQYVSAIIKDESINIYGDNHKKPLSRIKILERTIY